MIGKLARRLGFEPSVPVALIDDWITPHADEPLVELAPREGAAACLVDEHGRLAIHGAAWCLDLTIEAGARWVPVGVTDHVEQRLVAPAVLETTIRTPAGTVVQRVAAGVVDSKPVAVVEIENAGGVAVAIGLVARPLRHDGRGHIGEIAIDGRGLAVDRSRVVRFMSAPASIKAQRGLDGDLMQAMPQADDTQREAAAKCRSGGAQAAAVWPVPHTATLRFVVELTAPTDDTSAVPATDDINRGWLRHLEQGLRIEVDDRAVGEHLSIATRSLLTAWPRADDAPAAVAAASEAGFARDAARFFPDLDRCDDDEAVLRALARWAQLGEPTQQFDDLDVILGRLARAAHVIAARGGRPQGAPWLPSALVALGGRLHQIDQPDVGARIQAFVPRVHVASDAYDRFAEPAGARDRRGVWKNGQIRSAAQLVRSARALVVADAGSELRLLPDLPAVWRGRTIDVLDAPVANGSLSFGLRWHGPRPALLWQATLAPDAPVRISVPGIDPAFESHERQGEALLADPGWPAP